MEGLFHRPVSPFSINQHFGEKKSCMKPDGSSYITCDGNNPPEGYVSTYGPLGHTGLDLAATHSVPVYCAADGVVYFIDTQPKTGLDVRVESTLGGRRFQHIYEHLLGYQPKVGDKVRVGDLLGWADNTGRSSGDHLHFEVREYLNGVWTPIDPETVLSTMYALDARKLEDKIGWLREQVARLADLVADYLRNKKQNV